MLKYIGSLVAVFSGTLIGYYFSKRGEYRAAELTEMKRALNMLRSSIEYSVILLPEAVLDISEKCTGIISALFNQMHINMKDESETAYTAWVKSVDSALKNSYLTTEDSEMIAEMGQTLGYIDKRLQLSGMTMLTDYIDLKCAELRENAAKNKNLFTSLGIMSGLLVTVVLI